MTTTPTDAPINVGFPVSKANTDQAIGQLARTIEQWRGQAEQFDAWLQTMPDAQLVAPPFNYSGDEVALLKSAAGDLALLARIYAGDETLAEAKDFGQFARRTAGLFLT